jgi:hypothetical protein
MDNPDVSMLLKGSFATRNGRIDPWGTIRILMEGASESGTVHIRAGRVVLPGVPIWSQKLLKFKDPMYRAIVQDGMIVVKAGTAIVKTLSPSDCAFVEIREYLVLEEGYLQSVSLRAESPQHCYDVARSLRQAGQGRPPSSMDNSTFVRIAERFASMEVLELEFSPRDRNRTEHRMVFTKDGKRIPHKEEHPLSFARWNTSHSLARYCRT